MGALSQARLAVMFPNAGGDYVYLREIVGPLPAFLSGWISLSVGFAGAIAVQARSVSQYASVALLGQAPSPTIEAALSVGIILVFSALNLCGVSLGTRVQSSLTVLKTVGLLALAAAAIAFAPDTAGAAPWSPTSSLLPAALMAVVFTYSGWNDSIYVAGEVVRPERNLPLSLIAGTAAVTAVYIVFNLGYIVAVGPGAPAEGLAAASSMAAVVFGEASSRVVASLAAILILGCLSAVSFTGPRIAFAMARDGVAAGSLARVSSNGSPANAVLFQGAMALIFVALGSLERIMAWVGLAIVVFSALATACVLAKRVRLADLPYRVPLFPIPPLLYLAASVGLAAYVAAANPLDALIGVGLLAAGAAAFRLRTGAWNRPRSR